MPSSASGGAKAPAPPSIEPEESSVTHDAVTRSLTVPPEVPVWRSWSDVPRDVESIKASGPWFLEIFSGTATLTQAVRAVGISTSPPVLRSQHRSMLLILILGISSCSSLMRAPFDSFTVGPHVTPFQLLGSPMEDPLLCAPAKCRSDCQVCHPTIMPLFSWATSFWIGRLRCAWSCSITVAIFPSKTLSTAFCG